MSEDFLSRWSRRKRDVGETEQAKSAPSERDGVPENAVPKNAATVETARAIESGKSAVFDVKSLPPIESITAATDIRPFLAPGVPVDLARAALRRAWSADPRIRDFVGLADYDWDYNTPGSAAGFGPLEMTEELRRMVGRILGDIVDAPDRAREQAIGPESVDESPALGAEARGPSPADREQPLATPSHAPRPATPGEPTVAEAAALQYGISEDRGSRSTPKRGHGRALPR
jgi:uncharacterized protein DUF3306